MVCIPCTKIGDKYVKVIGYYKDLYNRKGFVYYVFRLSPNSDWQIVSRNQFKWRFDNEIKPRLKDGAEYYHISEFQES